MLLKLDFFLWRCVIPRINADFFKNKMNSTLAIAYISLFRFPRKFLIHYFFGKGKKMKIDTRRLISRNRAVLKKMVNEMGQNEKQNAGCIDFAQTELFQPNDRYSVGSFRIHYQKESETVKIRLYSYYHFQEAPDRITRYLHHWLHTLKSKGWARDFTVEGNTWKVRVDQLSSTGNPQKPISGLRGKLFV